MKYFIIKINILFLNIYRPVTVSDRSNSGKGETSTSEQGDNATQNLPQIM